MRNYWSKTLLKMELNSFRICVIEAYVEKRKRKQTTVTNITKRFVWCIKLDVSYAARYIFRKDDKI